MLACLLAPGCVVLTTEPTDELSAEPAASSEPESGAETGAGPDGAQPPEPGEGRAAGAGVPREEAPAVSAEPTASVASPAEPASAPPSLAEPPPPTSPPADPVTEPAPAVVAAGSAKPAATQPAATQPAAAQPAAAQPSPDEGAEPSPTDLTRAEIEAVLEGFYAACRESDWPRASAFFWEEGTIASIRASEGEELASVSIERARDFFAALGARNGGAARLLQGRIEGSVELRTAGRVAQAWCRYVSTFGGPEELMEWKRFAAFTLVQHEDTWRIAALVESINIEVR